MKQRLFISGLVVLSFSQIDFAQVRELALTYWFPCDRHEILDVVPQNESLYENKI